MIYRALLRLIQSRSASNSPRKCLASIRALANKPDPPVTLRCFDFKPARLAEFYSTLPERSGSLLLKEDQ